MGENVGEPENPGTLRELGKGRYFAQFSTGSGRRGGTIVSPSRGDAERRQLAVARLVAKLREAGYPAMIRNVIRDACAAPNEEELRKIARVVERVASGKEPALARAHGARREGTTVKELAELWTSGELAKEYPDHVRIKKPKQVSNDKRVSAWLGKMRMPDGSTFGDRAVADVTLDDCDHAMANLPKTAETSSTRRHYAQTIRKLLVYAVYPLRLREAVPIPKGWLPSGASGKAKGWIYPSEDLALMRCRKLPVARRLFFGTLDREGFRVSEALGLTWADLDLERGVVRLDVNKTDDPRSWVMAEDVTRALATWKKLRGSKVTKSPRVFPSVLLGHATDLAHLLREGLTLAGVKRPELTEPKPGRLLLRAHDLRGSFVTLALANGRTEAWVTDRTGHRSSQMIYLYKRASRTAAELGLGWFAPLDEAIPELTPKPRQGANGVQTGGTRGSQTSRGERRNPGKQAVSRRAETGRTRLLSRGSQVRVLPGVPAKLPMDRTTLMASGSDECGSVCTSVCTPPPDEAVLQAAIDRLTRALATAEDDAIGALVAERAELRGELRALREVGAGVVGLDEERTRRDRER
jgi:integrase